MLAAVTEISVIETSESKVWWNSTIPSQEASENLFISSSNLKSFEKAF